MIGQTKGGSRATTNPPSVNSPGDFRVTVATCFWSDKPDAMVRGKSFVVDEPEKSH